MHALIVRFEGQNADLEGLGEGLSPDNNSKKP